MVNIANVLNENVTKKYIIVPFDLMRHGIKVDMTPLEFRRKCVMKIEDTFVPMEWGGYNHHI